MRWFIALVGISWIVLGLFSLVATRKTTIALCSWIKNTKRQSIGMLGLIFGLLLLISASSAREVWFVFGLGIISCLKGTIIILVSEKKLQAVIDWWLAAPEIIYKEWAALLLVLGVAMFYVI